MSPTYSVKDIENLSQIERVRRFPSRFLGDDVFTTAAREIIDNAGDEVGRGFADHLHLTFHPDGSIEVADNGRGLPIDYDADMVTETGHKGVNGIVKTLGTLGAGGNYSKDDASGTITAGVHGEGGAATNAICSRFDVTVYQGGKIFTQQFSAGAPGSFAGTGFDPAAAFTPREGVKLTGTKAATSKAPIPGSTSGTSVRFMLDRSLLPDADLDAAGIVTRAQVAARLREGMNLTITGPGPDGEQISQEFTGEGGYGAAAVLDYVGGAHAAVTVTSDFTFTRAGKSIPASVGLAAGVATSGAASIHSVMNTVWTPLGGTYQDAAALAVGEAVASKPVRGLDRQNGEPYPTPADFAAVSDMVVSVSMAAKANFGSQAKANVVGERSLNSALATAINRKVVMWAASPANSKTLLAWATAALAHARTTRKIEAARAETRKTSSAGRGSNLSLPDKYLPCANTGRGSGSELHICEGDSALGTIKNARDALFQAAFPLRGKTLNTHGKTLAACRKNVEVAAIEAILGCGVRENCDPEACRFDRIFFTTDADVDGYNISSSLLDLFVENYYPLIEAGMLFIAQPPLFIVSRTNGSDRRYCVDEAARDAAVEELVAAGHKADVQRCKGLGEMTPADFAETVMGPDTRTIFKVSYDPDTESDTFDTVFGPSAAARRTWINDMAANADLDVAM